MSANVVHCIKKTLENQLLILLNVEVSPYKLDACMDGLKRRMSSCIHSGLMLHF